LNLDLTEQRRNHDRDPHVAGRWLSDLVLGAQDGVVNTLGVVLGVASATDDARVVLATGLAAAAAESISMAAVAYTSSLARGDLYRAERAREYRHVDTAPLVEREEVREIFAKRGFSGELLERAVDTVCSDRDVWVAMMMSEEHRLGDVDRRDSLRSAAVVGFASVLASVLPVLPFVGLQGIVAKIVALAVGVLLLFSLGVFKARITTGSPSRSGLSLAAIGIASALAGYLVGALVGPR
jgi:predicted membrane protein (TIGR00267 family)